MHRQASMRKIKSANLQSLYLTPAETAVRGEHAAIECGFPNFLPLRDQGEVAKLLSGGHSA